MQLFNGYIAVDWSARLVAFPSTAKTAFGLPFEDGARLSNQKPPKRVRRRCHGPKPCW